MHVTSYCIASDAIKLRHPKELLAQQPNMSGVVAPSNNTKTFVSAKHEDRIKAKKTHDCTGWRFGSIFNKQGHARTSIVPRRSPVA